MLVIVGARDGGRAVRESSHDGVDDRCYLIPNQSWWYPSTLEEGGNIIGWAAHVT